MSVITRSVTLTITFDTDVWQDPLAWDWSDLVGEVWDGPIEGRTVRLAGMHLDDEHIPWGQEASDADAS